jgi:adenosine kinase
MSQPENVIALTGSMAFDYIMSFPGQFTDYLIPDQLENLSVSFLVDSMRRERGGTAGNIAYSLALLKQPCRLLAPVGRDASDYIADLDKLGVDVSRVLQVDEDFTASFFVSTDRSERQIASFFVGALVRSTDINLADHADKVGLVTVCATDPQAMMQHARQAKELGLKCMFDPSQQTALLDPADLREGLDGAFMLTVNEYEYELVKKRTGLSDKDIDRLVDIVVITRGGDGVTIHAEGTQIGISAIPNINVADPTGAGDAFRAGLLAGWRHGLDWVEAGRLGTLTAAYALENVGTQRQQYTLQQFASRYFECFDHTAGVEQFFQSLS